MGKIAVVVPAYEPDERLIDFLKEMTQKSDAPVILVDDGSGEAFAPIFGKALPYVEKNGGRLLVHEVNGGKGKALKTAAAYLNEHRDIYSGAVIADADGQHSPDCVMRVMEELREHPDSLIIGARSFDGQDVPWKSRMGNKITEKVFSYVADVHVSDTQTGLRGIPSDLLEVFPKIKGDRFEFEMEMLLYAADHYPIREVKIKTIYDSKENHSTHFNTVKDSARIYRILGGRFIRFIFSSLSSSVIDLVLFAIFCALIKAHIPDKYAGYYAGFATIAARCISAVYNYLMNYKVVFKSEAGMGKASLKYFALALVQMCASAALVTAATFLLPAGYDVFYKLVVDTLLFFVSYKIQQKFVFK